MAQDRPSWKEIDRVRDGGGGGRRKKKEERELKEHSTRYDRYKADLNRLFDQGMAGELLKKVPSNIIPSEVADAIEVEEKAKKEAEAEAESSGKSPRRKGNGRIPKDSSRSSSRLKLIRTIVDTQDPAKLRAAIDELAQMTGLPDDFEVLTRVLEHPDEILVRQAVAKMLVLLPKLAKIPRRQSLKERLRTTSQTAKDTGLRTQAAELFGKL